MFKEPLWGDWPDAGRRPASNGGVTLKLGTVCLVFFLALVPISAPSTLAAGGGAGVSVNPSHDGSGGGSDPNSVVDRNEPSNNDCGGAENWRGRTADTSSGIAGWKDPADWSVVELYRTESMTAQVAKGHAVVSYAPYCGADTTLAAPLNVQANGRYPIQVSPTIGTAAYIVEYAVTPNDASGPGTDVGNLAAAAFYYNAMPRSMNPREHFFVSGSLPNRPDLGADQDWFRIGTGMAHALEPGDLTLGLLTVTFSADCNGGSYRLSLVSGDGLRDILKASPGCGTQQLSCIAAGFSPIYAKTEVLSGRGTGYDFSADLSPLYVVSVTSGDVTVINPTQPWCDQLTPIVLGLANAGGGATDLLDREGRVVARVTKPELPTLNDLLW